MKNYQIKKDADGWTVWSYGVCQGRFFRVTKEGRWVYKVVGYTEFANFDSKDKAVRFILGF